MKDTTIVAISTSFGEAGIGVIRLSGPDALLIAKKIFIPAKKKENFEFKNRYMHYGKIIDPENGKILDEVLCVYMKGPHTYTGEDLVEIQSHGSIVSEQEILKLCLRMGAESAQRGEFSKRAFLNGRIDLSQAEAIIDLIKAKTEKSFDVALDQMQGSLSSKVKEIRKALLDQLVSLSVNMDYPDEDIEVLTYENFKKALIPIIEDLEKLAQSAKTGAVLREGIRVAIVGKPNVGKSSLMNSFLKEDRSIVTDIAGTTRDTVEALCNVRGIPVSFIDTAGIRDAKDAVEAIGVERSKKAFNEADIVLVVLDQSRALDKEDLEILDFAKERNAIVVLNKEDLPAKVSKEEIVATLASNCIDIVSTSTRDSESINKVFDALETSLGTKNLSGARDNVAINARHTQIVKNATSELKEALAMIDKKEALDFIEVNVNSAFTYLGEITGETASDEIINEVFARFCLGK